MKSNSAQRFSNDDVANAIEHHLREVGEHGVAHPDSLMGPPMGAHALVVREKKALWPRRKISDKPPQQLHES